MSSHLQSTSIAPVANTAEGRSSPPQREDRPLRSADKSRRLTTPQVVLIFLAGGAVIASVLLALHWEWGIFYGQHVSTEFYPDGKLLAEVTVKRQRADRIDSSLWGGAAPTGRDWYWVAEFRGYFQKTGGPTEHGFFLPYPVVTGDAERDHAARKVKGQIKEGFWTNHHETGNRLSEGPYVNGKESGRWTTWHPNGKLHWQCNYVDGQRNGEMKLYDEQGRHRHTLNFTAGKMDGSELLYDENGILNHRFEWENGIEHGARLSYHPGGKLLQSSWQMFSGRMSGPHEQRDVAGRLLVQGNYENDKKEGVWARYHPNGQKHSEQTFFRDRLHGHETVWYADGKLMSEGEYRDEIKASRWVTYSPKGEKSAEGDYVDGNRHGPWKFWESDGKVTLVTYDKGKVVAEQSGTAP